MPHQTNPLHPMFAAEVTGLDITVPPATLPAKELKGLIDRYGVVVYRNARLPSDEQHVEFSRLFGPVEVGPMFKIQGDKKRIDNPALVDVGNLDADSNIMKPDNRRMLFRKGDRLWHTDMSFHHNRATYSLLLGHEIPPDGAGGDTLFADMRAAYDALPEPMKVDDRRPHRRTFDLAFARARGLSRGDAGRTRIRGRPPITSSCTFIRARAARRSISPRTPPTLSAGRSNSAAA